MTLVFGPVHYTELTMSFPNAKFLWFTATAAAWKDTIESDFGLESLPVSAVDCLADLPLLQNLPATYDMSIARLSVLHGISSLIRTHYQSHLIAHSRGFPPREAILVEDSQHRWLVRAFESLNHQFRLPHFDRTPPFTMLLLVELLSLHFCASIDQMELLAGKEGFDEAQAAYSTLQLWVESREARQALWHSGQILKVIRDLPVEAITDFHCVAAYHVSLCLWAYGSISAKRMSNTYSDMGDMGSSLSPDQDVVLDEDETLKTQRWIASNCGRPVFSNPQDGEVTRCGTPLLLHATGDLLEMCVRTIRLKYPSRAVLPPATENLCNLMHALKL